MQKNGMKSLAKNKDDSKREISDLRKQLNDINKKKEEAYNQRNALKKEILDKINHLKKNYKLKDMPLINIKKEKGMRDRYNAKVRELILKVREFGRKKKDIAMKYNIKNISKIDEDITNFETDIETKALSFNNEKKLMEKIKRLKKIKNELSSMDVGAGKRDEIDGYKKKADACHEKIKQFLEDRKKYNKFILASREINELKKTESEAHKSFLALKNEFNGINDKLKNSLFKLKIINDESNRFEHMKKREREKEQNKKKIKKEKEQDKILEIKAREVEEKIKKGKKLTEEDLIAFQK